MSASAACHDMRSRGAGSLALESMISHWHRKTKGRRRASQTPRGEARALVAGVSPSLRGCSAPGLSRTPLRVVDLVGREMPSVALTSYDGLSLDLGEFSRGFPLAIYVYPAISSCPENTEDTRTMDAAQHRAFRDHQRDLETLGYRAIGISNQSIKSQAREVSENGLSHRLLSDPQLQLANELDLPTVSVDGNLGYRRLTLIMAGGFIEKIFFPIENPARSAAQVTTWIRLSVAS
jgi:peroxiredoxin